jgi:hypothetical protein
MTATLRRFWKQPELSCFSPPRWCDIPLSHWAPSERLRVMKDSTTYFNRPTAEVIANHIADSRETSVNIIDILVSGSTNRYAIQLEYELNGETHQRVLRTLKEVDSFLRSPSEFTVNTSPEIVSSHHERDLY